MDDPEVRRAYAGIAMPCSCSRIAQAYVSTLDSIWRRRQGATRRGRNRRPGHASGRGHSPYIGSRDVPFAHWSRCEGAAHPVNPRRVGTCSGRRRSGARGRHGDRFESEVLRRPRCSPRRRHGVSQPSTTSPQLRPRRHAAASAILRRATGTGSSVSAVSATRDALKVSAASPSRSPSSSTTTTTNYGAASKSNRRRGPSDQAHRAPDRSEVQESAQLRQHELALPHAMAPLRVLTGVRFPVHRSVFSVHGSPCDSRDSLEPYRPLTASCPLSTDR